MEGIHVPVSQVSSDGAQYWALEKDTLAAAGQTPPNISRTLPPPSHNSSTPQRAPRSVPCFPSFERAVTSVSTNPVFIHHSALMDPQEGDPCLHFPDVDISDFL